MSPLLLVTAFAAQAAAPPPSDAVPAGPASRASKIGSLTYVDVEGGVGYSTNPILSFGGNTGRGFGRISLDAVHTRVSDRTTTVLSAYAQNLTYTGRYGSQQSFDLRGSHDAAVNEKLNVFASADLSYDKGGQLDARVTGFPDVPSFPGTSQPPVLLPPGSDFLSVTGKQWRESGQIGGQLKLSPKDFLTASTEIEHAVFRTAQFDSRYTNVYGTLGYSRQISPRTTIGAQLAAQYSNYSGPGSSRTISPQLTAQILLSPRLSFSGAIGASFGTVDDGLTTRHSTGLSANANLCSQGERSQLCAQAAINQDAATAAGPARTITAGLEYSRRLDQNQTIQFTASANHYSAPTSFVVTQSFSNATYVRAAAEYTRRIGRRWFAGATLAGRKVAESGPDPKADISGSLLVRYRFGDVQ